MNKLRKDWKTISLTTLLALGGASLLGNHHVVHADVNAQDQTQHVTNANTKTAQDINPNTKIQIKPEVLNSLASNDNNKPSQQSAKSSTSFSYTANSSAQSSSTASSSVNSNSNGVKSASKVSNQNSQSSSNTPILDVLGKQQKSSSASVAPSAKSSVASSVASKSTPKSVSASSSASVKPKSVSNNNNSLRAEINRVEAEIQQEKNNDNSMTNAINQDDQTIESDENADPADSGGNVYFWNQSSASSSNQSAKPAKAKLNQAQKTTAKPTKRAKIVKQIAQNNKRIKNANNSISKFANKIHHQQRAVKYHSNPKNKATARVHRKFTKRTQTNYHKLANAYDVSSYQGYINNAQARKLKREVNFMILKAQGGNIKDPQISHNEYEMAKNKIPYGAYSYSYYSSPANARIEAQELVQRAPKAKFYVNDCEGNYTYGSLNASTQAWAHEMHRLTKKPVILYSGAYFMGSQLSNRTRKAYDGLWLADYGYEPNTPYHYDLWQDYDNFYSPALGKRVDADVFPNQYNKPLRFWTNGRK